MYVALGLIEISMGFVAHTATHQLKRSPNVSVKKSRRETVPEVAEPDNVLNDSDSFIKKSFFRKVAHVQDFDNQSVMPDPMRGDVLARYFNSLIAITLLYFSIFLQLGYTA